MSDLSITTTAVIPGADAVTTVGVAGESISPGKTVYKASSEKWMLSDCNSSTVPARVPDGVALTGSALNQPIVVQKSGDITIGGTLTPGVAYYQSANAGGICLVADLSSGMYPTILGIAKSASVLALDIQPSGVAL